MRTGIALGACAVASLLAVSAARAEGYRSEKRFELGPGGRLTLRTEAGGAEVRGGEGRQAVVTVTSKRSDFAERYDLRFEEKPGELSVVIERKGPRVLNWSWSGEGATVVVELPRKTSVEVSSSGGGVTVEGLQGTVEASSSGGGARVTDVDGELVASSSGGGVEVERIAGGARLDSSGGSVVARRVAGDLEAESSGGGVRIEEAGGAVVASSSGGSVRVGFAAGNGRGGRIESSGGGVAVTLDPAVGLELDASASGGSVDCELPVTVRGKQARSTLRGTLNGGGERLELRSSGGGVTIAAR